MWCNETLVEVKERDGRKRDEEAISMTLQTASFFENVPLDLPDIVMDDVERGITAEAHRQSRQQFAAKHDKQQRAEHENEGPVPIAKPKVQRSHRELRNNGHDVISKAGR